MSISIDNKPSATPVSTRGELVVKGVATAVAAAAIIETGKGVMVTFAKRPIIMFGMGLLSGYLVHKYRKEILLLTGKTAEQSKDFLIQQKEQLKELLEEAQV